MQECWLIDSHPQDSRMKIVDVFPSVTAKMQKLCCDGTLVLIRKDMKVYPNVTWALCANSHPGSYTGQDAFNDMFPVIERDNDDLLDETVPFRISEGGAASTLKNRDYKDFTDIVQEDKPDRKYILRRLTPLECCRLQGFPDWWTDGVPGSDSNVYKMWGNGIALPCAADVIGRLAKELEGDNNGQD